MKIQWALPAIFILTLILAACGRDRTQPDAAASPSQESPVQSDHGQHAHTNRLVHEKSPYLLQHAHNPVDWYPWGEEALARARDEDKPIFLSIGYSTCHWCHVMERESFEDSTIAALMNENFVCIKVDREERPDIDEIYMAAVQAMSGRGGWPLSMWLTPELKPFYGGTYFPPDDRFGRPGFQRILVALSDAFQNRRDEVERSAEQLGGALRGMGELPAGDGELALTAVDAAYESLKSAYDPEHGGWGAAPKFPRADFGSLSLRVFRRTGDPHALNMVTHTLDEMADGGMYDHLGGGFHRYSTDGEWLAPHFEKMLYDNAQLAFHYLEAYQLTGAPRYARVVRETLDYVLRDMTHPKGGFFSAEDADTEGEEGLFYVWQEAEVDELLPTDVVTVFKEHYDVTAAGNWEHKNILRRVLSVPELASRHDLTESDVEERLAKGREILLAHRATRTRPGLDDKVLSAWNGLMMTAMARAGVVLQDDRYTQAAANAARFIWSELRDDSGLLRRWREGEARFPAFAEDYAMVVRGLIEVYQSTFELEFAEHAIQLHAEMFEHFGDDTDGALFNTRAGQADLLVRAKTGYDGSVPTANSVAATNAILLYELTARSEYADQAKRLLQAFGGTLESRPTALVSMQLALDAYLGERVELVLAATDDGPRVQAMVYAARGGYHPDLIIALASGNANAAKVLPILDGKVEQGAATAYVCRAFACRMPTTDLSVMTNDLGLLVAEDRQ